jgi:hypothetical protein
MGTYFIVVWVSCALTPVVIGNNNANNKALSHVIFFLTLNLRYLFWNVWPARKRTRLSSGYCLDQRNR